MIRNTIAIAATGLAFASTAVLAQSGPDFSPMKPRTSEDLQAQGAYDAPTPPPALPAPNDNRMLDAYETSNTLAPLPAEPAEAGDAYANGSVAPPHRARVQPPTPSQSTIGHGLFDRRGPNDFGA